MGIGICAWGNISGAAFNPHRFIGPAIVSGELWDPKYSYCWIYIVGPYLGASLAALIWHLSFVDWNGKEEKHVKDNNLDVKTQQELCATPKVYINCKKTCEENETCGIDAEMISIN